MENSIVREFQKLRVLSSARFGNMDALVQDLSNALEESSRASKNVSGEMLQAGIVRRLHKKRRGRKRRSNPGALWEYGNFSEASESSLDEAIKDYIENVAQQSDSDDLAAACRISRLTLPLGTNYMPAVESDSVTENFSPIRPQRRRKKYKTMAVDPSPEIRKPGSTNTEVKCHRVTIDKNNSSSLHNSVSNNTNNLPDVVQVNNSADSNGDGNVITPGKRKRNTRRPCDYHLSNGALNNSNDNEKSPDSAKSSNMEVSNSQESSISSSESDSLLPYDAAREADDEQSDFFHEPGPTCGIAGIIPWWENERLISDNMETDVNFQRILKGITDLEHLPRSASFQARVKHMLGVGREIRVGRRKLKGKIPGYTMSKYLQDKQKWSSVQQKYGVWQACGANLISDAKRQRKTPPTSPLPEGFTADKSQDAIPESNIGNRMLQNMGWTPGTGLGADGSGMRAPLVAHLRPKRQGLGCSSSRDKSMSDP